MTITDTYTIRSARLEDVKDLVALWNELAETHQTDNPQVWNLRDNAAEIFQEHLFDSIDTEDTLIYIAVDSHDKPAGFIIGMIKPNPAVSRIPQCGYIAELFVLPEIGGDRLGIELLQNIINDFQYRGLKEVRLHVARFNSFAKELYKKMGFIEYSSNMHLILSDTDQELL